MLLYDPTHMHTKQHQAIIWTNADLSAKGPLGKHLN